MARKKKIAPDSVLYEVRQQVAWITLNRPALRNALNLAMLRKLELHWKSALRNKSVRVIVLCSVAGVSFCAGADLTEMLATKTLVGRKRFFSALGSLIETISASTKTTISKVQGHCLAGGCGLVAGCDLVYATPESKFGLPELKIGLAPMVVLAPLSKVVAPRALYAMALTAQLIDAIQAKRCGLITDIIPSEVIDKKIEELGASLADFSPTATRHAKQALKIAREMPQGRAMAKLSKMIATLSLRPETELELRQFAERTNH